MKRLEVSGISIGVIGLILVLGSAASAPASNSGHQRLHRISPVMGQNTVATAVVVSGRHLKSTAISSGYTVPVPASWSAIDAVTTLRCPGTTTCTFTAEQSLDVVGSTTDNAWAICTKVDGNYMSEPNCPYMGNADSAFNTNGSFTQTKTGIAPGNHTVQSDIFTLSGFDSDTYTIIYSVYTP